MVSLELEERAATNVECVRGLLKLLWRNVLNGPQRPHHVDRVDREGLGERVVDFEPFKGEREVLYASRRAEAQKRGMSAVAT